MNSSNSSTVKITDAYTVNPTILALRIETGEVIKGKQIPYTPQPGDSIDKRNNLYRNGNLAGVMAAGNTIVRTFDTLEGPELDTNWADNINNYTIKSKGDSDFSQGITPTNVFRKSKVAGIAQTGPWDFGWPMEHTVFLELPEPLEQGKTYTIDFSGNGVEDTAFTYAPTRDRSEAVHISHFGFDPDSPTKVAFLSTWMGSEGQDVEYTPGQKYWLIDERTGSKVYEGTIELSKDKDDAEDSRGNNYNGTNVYIMDFSDFTTEGTYTVAVDGVGTSFAFDIGEQTWAESFYVSARGMYHQRSGIALEQPYTEYERPRPFHPDDGVKIYQSTSNLMDTSMGLNPDVDTFEALVAGKTNQLVSEAWGGWFDAGDWDRRIQHLDVTRSMLELAELFPDYFDDVSLNIPESNNALPDIIDEALWGLDFFKRLQLDNGGVRGGVESASHPARFEASWQESQEIMVYAPDMWSSYKYAATAAYAAHVLKDIAPAKANQYKQSAIKAMEWAEREFGNIPKNTQTYGAVYDERSLAAAELYRLSGSERWHQIFLETTVFDDANAVPNVWKSHNRQDAAFTYSRTERASINQTIQNNAENALLRAADAEIDAINNTGFRWNKNPWAPLGWGSMGPNSTNLLRAHTLSNNAKYLKSGILATQFIMGANPDNVSYTTGLGHRTPDAPLIVDSIAVGGNPPPGVTLYGPVDLNAYSRWDWALNLFNEAGDPDPKQWPVAEGHFDVPYLVPHSEFTIMQSMAPMSYNLGYLAALHDSPLDTIPEPPTPEPIPEPPTPEPIPEPPTPEPTPEPPISEPDVIPVPEGVIGEYGTLSLNHRWQTVDLDHDYVNPVVIVSDPTFNGADPTALRLQNITDDSFQLRLQEPNYKDGKHIDESVSYLVVEAGDWTLADGTRISAGTHDTGRLTSKGFDTIGLQGFDETPTILSQVQTFKGADWVTTRITEQSQQGFQLAMQEEEALNSGGHISETLGWLAIDQGMGSDGDTLLQGGMTDRAVSSDRTLVTFEEAFDAAPSVIAKLDSYYGKDTANLRLDTIGNVSFGARVHEEKSRDTEISHTSESVSFLALEGSSGTLTGMGI
ncbi:MAG: glycoside hydrolase family 9 protein [Cyanobacteria bacterium P01_D01_bin.56]